MLKREREGANTRMFRLFSATYKHGHPALTLRNWTAHSLTLEIGFGKCVIIQTGVGLPPK
jgi:hypothetical protein